MTTTSADVAWLTNLVLLITQAVLVAQEDHLVHPYQVYLGEVGYLLSWYIDIHILRTYVRMYLHTVYTDVHIILHHYLIGTLHPHYGDE